MVEQKLERFLTDLATKDVAASAQNQAVNARARKETKNFELPVWESENPNGIPPQSPGLPRSCAQGRGYPGLAFEKTTTPKGCASFSNLQWHHHGKAGREAQPRWGLKEIRTVASDYKYGAPLALANRPAGNLQLCPAPRLRAFLISHATPIHLRNTRIIIVSRTLRIMQVTMGK